VDRIERMRDASRVRGILQNRDSPSPASPLVQLGTLAP